MADAGAGRLVLVPNALDFGIPGDGPSPSLDEVLPRAVIARAARMEHWVAENAKSARAFLNRVAAIEPLACALQSMSIAELPRAPKGTRAAAPPPEVLARLLAPATQGRDVGLICEAGMPAIADPGAALVAAAHRTGIAVVPLSGPNSLMLALAASGMNGQSFAFVGYLPVDAAARAQRIRELEGASRRLRQTQLMIETPYRNAALLGALVSHLAGDTRLSVSCGLTLPSHWTRSDTVDAWRRLPASMPGDVPAVFCVLAG
jgi:16S rRNA (cytidine1402-2'-O)-methyltransferase